MANVWLPHNLTDTINLIGKYIKFGRLDAEEYYPDFPTGGTIVNKDELHEINETGKGKVILEAAYKIKGREITFYEMPYQVYIEDTINKIKEQVEKGTITGIKDVLNKSDKKQIALVIECQRGVDPENVLEQLFQYTPLRSQYNANQNGIISKTPVLLNLRQTIDVYIQHNLSCIKRECAYDLDRAQARLEILEGLQKALVDIDKIISIIRDAENGAAAKTKLIATFEFTDNQAKAILDMKLSKLTKLDGAAIDEELEEKKKLISFCEEVIDSEDKQKEILLDKLRKMGKEYKTERRTKVIQKEITKLSQSKKKEEVIEQVVIINDSNNYLLRVPLSNYKNSRLPSFKCNSNELVLLLSNKGKFYRVKAKSIKSCGMKDKGTAIGTLISLDQDERILGVFPNRVDEAKPYMFFAMQDGSVKKISVEEQLIGTTQNLKGMIATKAESEVAAVAPTNGDDIILGTNDNYFLRFAADEVRPTGRNSKGIKGITLQDNDFVVCLYVVGKDEDWNNIPCQSRARKGKRYAGN